MATQVKFHLEGPLLTKLATYQTGVVCLFGLSPSMSRGQFQSSPRELLRFRTNTDTPLFHIHDL